jgi:hypothetical protein
MKKGYRFKGWDWQELAEAFELDLIDLDDDSDENVFLVTDFLFEVLNRRNEKEMKEIVKFTKRFLKQLIKQGHTYCGPLWKGLSEIKSDYVLIQMIIPLLAYMWD